MIIMEVIFGINTTGDISKLSQISLAVVKLRLTILKYHSCYLCQITNTNHAISYTNFPQLYVAIAAFHDVTSA